MNASDAGLIIVTVLALWCLCRRRCGASEVLRKEQNELLMNLEVERKPQA